MVNETQEKQSQEHKQGGIAALVSECFFHFDLQTIQLGINSFVRMPRRGKGLIRVAVRITYKYDIYDGIKLQCSKKS